MINLIELAFKDMVKGIEDTVSETAIPSAYYNNESFAEINSVYQFVKFFESKEKSAIYFEYPCDSGRVDAIVVVENQVILIEAKRGMEPKKFKVLNAQATRFEYNIVERYKEKETWLHAYYKDKSLLDYLRKVKIFIKEKWGITKPIELYGVLLADSNKKIQVKRWGDEKYYNEISLETMSTYSHQTIENRIHEKWIHLLAYKSLGALE